MSSKKVKVTLTLDADLVRLAKMQYPNFSGRVNDLISIDLHSTDEEAVLMKEIMKLQQTLDIKQDKLCDIRRKNVLLTGDETNINRVLDWAREISERKGSLGLNLLEKECQSKKVSFSNIKNILRSEGVEFVNYA